MADPVVMPALEMAQETGVLVRWLKQEGESVSKGEPVMEVETDKSTVEIEAPGTGVLGGIRAAEGDVVPVGQTIAWILAPGEQPPAAEAATGGAGGSRARSFGGSDDKKGRSGDGKAGRGPTREPAGGENHPAETHAGAWAVTPLARNIAKENGIDLAEITPAGNRIEKADVLAHMGMRAGGRGGNGSSGLASTARLQPASPKARRLAHDRGIDLGSIAGTGPGGAVLFADLERGGSTAQPAAARTTTYETPSTLWKVMAQRMSESWASVPHFYLMREVDASGLLEWRDRAKDEVQERARVKLTLSDLFVVCAGRTLRRHPRVNAAWAGESIRINGEVNVGIAVAVDEGLVVPVVRRADTASLAEVAAGRSELVSLARERRLRPEDMAAGTFTITNLGMYNVDAFNAVVNPPQAAILAVGRVAERVVPVDGRPEIRPMLVMTLSCDHRVVDGARAAQFLDDLAATIEDPWRLLI